MNESIYTLVKENRFVNEWLYRHSLSVKLNDAKKDAENKVRSESSDEINIDDDLQNYCGELTEVNSDLKRIHALRVQEQQVKEGTIGLVVTVGVIILAIIIFVLL